MASWVGCPALGLLGSWQLSLPPRLTWDSQNLRGWTAKDWVATPEALSKMKRTSSVVSEPQRTNRPSLMHTSLFTLPRTSANRLRLFKGYCAIIGKHRVFLRLLRDNRKLETINCKLFKSSQHDNYQTNWELSSTVIYP